ncbi:MAG: hypothetical protein JJV99_06285 [Colwellia sp.]|nr:hypothetical protein [Colwellia sp.]
MKQIFIVMIIIGSCDFFGISNSLFSQFVLPYPYVRIPVMAVSAFGLFIIWQQHLITKADADISANN